MLNLFAGDDSAGGGGCSFECGDGVAVYGNGGVGITDLQGDVDVVGLFGDDVDVADGVGLEALGGSGESEGIGWEGVEVIDAAGVGDGSEGVAGGVVGEGEGGAGDDGAGRGGDGSLDGCAELSVSCGGAQAEDEDDCRAQDVAQEPLEMSGIGESKVLHHAS